MAGEETRALPPSYQGFSAKYGLPSELAKGIGDTTWETVIAMGGGLESASKSQRPEVQKLIKEISLKRMMLLERALENSHEGAFDPKLLVDAVKLLNKCESMAQRYDLDLKEFGAYIALVVEKVKKEKLARHEAPKRSITRFAPMDEEELEKFKKKTEYVPKRRK